MTQDETVCYDCIECDREDVDFELIPGSEKKWYDGYREGFVWEAKYKCPYCGVIVHSEEFYGFCCDDRVWGVDEE